MQLALLPLRGLGSQAATILASVASGEASAYVEVLRLLIQPTQLAALLTLAARCLPGVPAPSGHPQIDFTTRLTCFAGRDCSWETLAEAMHVQTRCRVSVKFSVQRRPASAGQRPLERPEQADRGHANGQLNSV